MKAEHNNNNNKTFFSYYQTNYLCISTSGNDKDRKMTNHRVCSWAWCGGTLLIIPAMRSLRQEGHEFNDRTKERSYLKNKKEKT